MSLDGLFLFSLHDQKTIRTTAPAATANTMIQWKKHANFKQILKEKFCMVYTEKTFRLEQQNVWLLSSQQKFFKSCWSNQTHFVNPTKLLLS